MKLESLKIFNDKSIGKIFIPDGLLLKTNNSFVPTVVHGRSLAVKLSEYEWILLKGGGWNYGGPVVYKSKKDAELIFGLCPLEAAKREIIISNEIQKYSDEFPKVLYYKKIFDYKLPNKFDCLKDIKYSNGKLVEPCILYTKVKFPYRIADIPYLTNNEKKEAISLCCKYWKINKKEYVRYFAKELARHVAILHKNNFINDTLEYSNVTMLAEIVDYELISYPGVAYHNGSDERWLLNERREKEILYASEIVLQLYALLHRKSNLYYCYELVVNEYKKINPEFIRKNEEIQKILAKEPIVV